VALIIESDGDVLVGSLPFLIPRDANHSPVALLAGLTDTDVVKFAKFTSDGKLQVDASVTIDNVDIGNVDLKAKDAFGVSQYLQVEIDPATARYALITNDPRFTFSGASLNVTSSPAPSSGGINKFGTSSTLDGIWVTVVSQTVLTGETFDARGFEVWGDADAEWSLEAGSTQIGGTRTSPSMLAHSVGYANVIPVAGPIVVSLKARHWYPSKTVGFSANLEGRLY
jgi:hypothetical protein